MPRKLIICLFDDILLGMCVHRAGKTLYFLFFLVFAAAFLGSCDVMDAIFPSAGSYKVNILINDVPLDESSFVRSNNKIRPVFEEPVSNDKDITALIVMLRDHKGEIVGEKVVYTLDEDESSEDGIVIFLDNLDGEMPYFYLPDDLQAGRYTFVSHIISGSNVLQRIQKPFYYLSTMHFSYEGINVYLPGITESPHLIPKETVILLELDLDFDDSLDPYIVWFDGRRRIHEGRFSEGAAYQFWSSPELGGFFSLRAEVFPVDDFEGLAGYQKGILLHVSSMAIDVNLISNDIPQLTHWYVFDGNLNCSKMTDLEERLLASLTRNVNPRWKGANGTYGLATGFNNVMNIPSVSISNVKPEIWQTLFRFKPINDGNLFSIQFGTENCTNMNLSIQGLNLVLTLSSPIDTVSRVFTLPDGEGINAFLTAGINFSIESGLLSANINIIEKGSLTLEPIALEIENMNEFKILLGFLHDESQDELTELDDSIPLFTAIWDEFALYYMPPMDVIIAEVNSAARAELNENL
jgi:hypothetical protein